jgi:hypothetical protein
LRDEEDLILGGGTILRNGFNEDKNQMSDSKHQIKGD